MEMKLKLLTEFTLLCVLLTTAVSSTQTQKLPLTSTQGLKLVNVTAESVTYNGRAAVRVTDAAPAGLGDEGRLAVMSNTKSHMALLRSAIRAGTQYCKHCTPTE